MAILLEPIAVLKERAATELLVLLFLLLLWFKLGEEADRVVRIAIARMPFSAADV